MTRKQRTVSLVLGGTTLLCLGAYASASYLLAPAVIDSGGGHATSSSHQLDCSIGGPVIAATTSGEATSTNYKLQVNTAALMETPAPPAPPPDGGGDGGCVPSAAAPISLLPLLGLWLAVRRRRM